MKTSTLIILVVLVSAVLAANIPTNGPENIEVMEGGEAVLTCKTAYPYRYCSFTHTASQQSYSLDADIPGYKDGTITYTGDTKTCGMKISNTTENQNGEWRCDITAIIEGKTRQGRGFANITVIRKPQDIVMTVNGVEGGDFRVKYPHDMDEKVMCKASGGRPAPIFKWMVGDKELNSVDQQPTTKTTTSVSPDGTTSYEQSITFRALQSHNGKHVICIAQHKGYSVQDLETGFNKKSELMDVSFKPVSALNDFSFYGMVTGEEGEIKIAFLSHPGPTSVEWIMHDQGEKPVFAPAENPPIESLDGRYTAIAITEGPTEGYYTAELKIAEVKAMDSETRNSMIVRNDLGATTYSFTIGIGNPPPSQSSLTSPWIFVIVGVLIVAVIIGLLVVRNKMSPICSVGSTTALDDIEKATEKDGTEGSDTESADNDVKETTKSEDESVPKQTVSNRITSLFSAMKKSVGGRKENYCEESDVKLQEDDANKDEPEAKKEDTIVYVDLDFKGQNPIVTSKTEKTEYADVTVNTAAPTPKE